MTAINLGSIHPAKRNIYIISTKYLLYSKVFSVTFSSSIALSYQQVFAHYICRVSKLFGGGCGGSSGTSSNKGSNGAPKRASSMVSSCEISSNLARKLSVSSGGAAGVPQRTIRGLAIADLNVI